MGTTQQLPQFHLTSTSLISKLLLFVVPIKVMLHMIVLKTKTNTVNISNIFRFQKISARTGESWNAKNSVKKKQFTVLAVSQLQS